VGRYCFIFQTFIPSTWRLKKAVKQSRRPSIEDYVKTLAARD
jgi:2-iminoacetate synthase ThiH